MDTKHHQRLKAEIEQLLLQLEQRTQAIVRLEQENQQLLKDREQALSLVEDAQNNIEQLMKTALDVDN